MLRKLVVPVERLDCRACGACCFGDEGWVHVDAAEDARIDASEALRALVVLTRHGAWVKRSLRMIDGRCAALASIAGEREGEIGRWSCSVYADRPSVCREVEKGSKSCRDARKARGLDVDA